jgi:hypothetical protein
MLTTATRVGGAGGGDWGSKDGRVSWRGNNGGSPRGAAWVCRWRTKVKFGELGLDRVQEEGWGGVCSGGAECGGPRCDHLLSREWLRVYLHRCQC